MFRPGMAAFYRTEPTAGAGLACQAHGAELVFELHTKIEIAVKIMVTKIGSNISVMSMPAW